MPSKTIPELSAITPPLSNNDLIVIEKGDGSGTKKMTYANFIAAISNEMVAKAALVNNGNQTSAGYALDARFGKTLWDNSQKLTGVTGVTANANLNTYTTAGEYYCNSNDTAATITNLPVSRAFRLTVELTVSSSNTDYIRQTVREYRNNVTYTRWTIDGGSSWSAWAKPDDAVVFQLGNAKSTSFTMRNNVAVIMVKRDSNYQLLYLDYWSAGASTVATNGNTLLTVTKSASSFNVTITNNYSTQTCGIIINPSSETAINVNT